MATTPISPKVKSGAAVGSIVALLVAYAGQVTPETFAFLGKWQTPAFLLFSLAAAIFAAYKTTDPLRVAVDPSPDGSYNITGLPEAPAAPAVSFAPTQAKLDALPATAEVTPVYGETTPTA